MAWGHQHFRRAISVALLASALGACGSAGPQLFGSGSEVSNTPLYNEAKIFYVLERREMPDPRRFSNLEEPWAEPYTAVPTPSPRAVKNGDPVTIIANKVYIPKSAPTQSRSAADVVGNRETRDIAVLLTIGLKPGVDEETIAVWYQRDVPADSVLEFKDLALYSIDAWNSDYPPYFKMRIVDVRAERNARTSELLKQVNGLGPMAASLAGTPAAGLLLSAGLSAARLILANDQNRMLMEFTFNLYAEPNLSQAGGMPLGVFKKGGMVLLGKPRGAPIDYWDKAYQYDFQRERVQPLGTGPSDPADTPFLMTTVMTVETLVPNAVKRRSAAIVNLLTNPEATVQADMSRAIEDAGLLQQSLGVLKARLDFRKYPTDSSLQTLITTASNDGGKLKDPERDFLLSTLRSATGVSFAKFSEYATWYDKCKDAYELDSEMKKLIKKPGVACKP